MPSATEVMFLNAKFFKLRFRIKFLINGELGKDFEMLGFEMPGFEMPLPAEHLANIINMIVLGQGT